MNRYALIRYGGYGFALLILMYLTLFVLSLIFHFGGGERPGVEPMIVLALVMGTATYGLLRHLRPRTRRQAVSMVAVWTIMVAGLTFGVTAANDTTSVVFGAWYDYVVYAAMLGAAWLVPRTER